MSQKGVTRSEDVQKQIRATAIKHALGIDEKRKLANKVTDLILEAYDLPTSPDADPALPAEHDLSIFRECLRLFRPADLDELVNERNIDDRCGYALCPRPHRKIPGAGVKTWNRKVGKDFKLLTTADIEKWCSDTCGERTAFVRAQLSSEPAWMREAQNDVKLLDEMKQAAAVGTLVEATKALCLSNIEGSEAAERLGDLSRERGEVATRDIPDQVEIVEKEHTNKRARPPRHGGYNAIEGHSAR